MGRNIPTKAANSELAIVPFASLADRPSASVFGECAADNFPILISAQFGVIGDFNAVVGCADS
jgi:hypothetical protein